MISAFSRSYEYREKGGVEPTDPSSSDSPNGFDYVSTRATQSILKNDARFSVSGVGRRTATASVYAVASAGLIPKGLSVLLAIDLAVVWLFAWILRAERKHARRAHAKRTFSSKPGTPFF